MGNSFLAQCSRGISQTQEQKTLPTIQNAGSINFNKKCNQGSNFQNHFFTKILDYLERSPQLEKVYQQLKKQKPILYSIETKEILDSQNVKNLKQLLKKQATSNKFSCNNQTTQNIKSQMNQSQFSQRNNTSLSFDLPPELSQTNQEEFQQKIKIIKFYVKPQNERESSFSSDFEKNIMRNRSLSGNFSDLNLKNELDLGQTPASIAQFDSFFIYRKQYIYVGFLDPLGKPHGPGQLYHIEETQNVPTCSIFIQAEFNNGSISTQDLIIIFKDASFYRGGFYEGAFHGKGHLKLHQNIELLGNFFYGFLEGKGKAIYLDGGIYQGSFKAGMKQGKGKMVWKSQKITNNDGSPLEICFEGFFNNDKMNGLGYLRTPNYEYWGPFSNNMKEGKGTIKFKNGNKFEGWFEKDQINGYGQLHYANGEVQKGIFPIAKHEG